jgi:hypothetical protein
VDSGALFLGSGESVQLCWVSVKGCHIRGLPTESVCVAYVDWCKKRMCHVYQVSHTWCISIQIVATFGYEYPLVCGSLHVAN